MLCAAAVFACKPEDRVSVDTNELKFDYKGGTEQIRVTSNTEWSVTSDPMVTVSPSSGVGDMVVSVSISENTTITPRTSTLVFTAGSAPAVTVNVTQYSNTASFQKFTVTYSGDYDGVTGTVDVEADGPWTVIAPEGVTVSATSGTGNGSVNFTVPENNTDDYVSYDIIFNCGFHQEIAHIVVLPALLPYGDNIYKIKKMPDGKWWMTEPLCYIPEGMKASEDPTDNNAHIWYPYAVENGNVVVKTDEETIKKNGYFYDMKTILDVDEIKPESAASLEGVQGICPDGWHVPTRAEYLALCGSSNKAVGEDNAPDNKDAFFYDEAMKGGSVVKFNEGGWNFVPTGARSKSSYSGAGSYSKNTIAEANTEDKSLAGLPALSYVATSTYYNFKEGSNLQFFALMSTFTTKLPGKLALAYMHAETGSQVRCVRND